MELVSEVTLRALEKGEKTYAHESKIIAQEIRAWRAGMDVTALAKMQGLIVFTKKEIETAKYFPGVIDCVRITNIGGRNFASYADNSMKIAFYRVK